LRMATLVNFACDRRHLGCMLGWVVPETRWLGKPGSGRVFICLISFCSHRRRTCMLGPETSSMQPTLPPPISLPQKRSVLGSPVKIFIGLVGALLVVSGALGVYWYTKSQEKQPARTKDKTPPELCLSGEERNLLWQIEHYGNVLARGPYGFKT